MGRFTSKDPVAGFATVPQSLNPYPYGVNTPLAYPDPDGDIAPAVVALAVARVMAADYAINAGIASARYMLTNPTSKGIDLGDFASTVHGEAFDATVADLKNPLTFSPLHKFDKVSDVLRLADEANDAYKYGRTPKGRPFTKHYGTDTGPERNIPGSVVDKHHRQLSRNSGGRRENGTLRSRE